MAGRLYRMAKVVSANPKSWGIVDANEISGFKRVAKLSDLYSIAECILSSSYGDGVTDGVDAVGQIWHVSETNGDYKLTNWANRKSAAGWTKLSYGDDVSVPVRDVHVNNLSVLSNGVAKIDLTPYAKTTTTDTLTNNVNGLQKELNDTNATVGALSNEVDDKLASLAETLTSRDVENFTITRSSRGVQGVGKLYYMQASITRKGGDTLNATIPCVVSAADTTNANAGLMSPVDKQKLDGIAEGANKTIIDTTLTETGTNAVQGKVIDNAIKTHSVSQSNFKNVTSKTPSRLLFYSELTNGINHKYLKGEGFVVKYKASDIPDVYYTKDGTSNDAKLLYNTDMTALTDAELTEILK